MFVHAVALAFAVAVHAAPPQTPLSAEVGAVKVLVVLGVMSRCPDAILCESVFDTVLKEVGDKIDLSLSFIAGVNATDRFWGVTCKHGAIECTGNVQQLCAQKYHPRDQWWAFVQCQNEAGKTRVGDMDLAQKCAQETDIDWEGGYAGQCASVGRNGGSIEGRELLKESAITSAGLNLEKSCTVVINGRQVCVRDSEWKLCEGGHEPEDFVRQINEEYEQLNG